LIRTDSLTSLEPGASVSLPTSEAWAASPDEGQDPLTCLTQAIYYEARSEPLAGQQAVAQVVLNRTASPDYPATVCGVVFERNDADVCQFSFACDGAIDRPIEPAAWDVAEGVAKRALAGFLYKPLLQATHFHAVWVSPTWSERLIRLRRIGGHVFYR
jgi:spore germination cell wall hydrolase CwlJ-like protein